MSELKINLYVRNGEEADAAITEDKLAELFEEFVNELHPVVTLFGCDYDPAQVLRETDPTAYRCGMADWSSAEFAEIVVPLDAWMDDDYDVIESALEAARR